MTPSIPSREYPAERRGLLRLFDDVDEARKLLNEREAVLDAAIAKWSADNGYLVHLRREAVRASLPGRQG